MHEFVCRRFHERTCTAGVAGLNRLEASFSGRRWCQGSQTAYGGGPLGAALDTIVSPKKQHPSDQGREVIRVVKEIGTGMRLPTRNRYAKVRHPLCFSTNLQGKPWPTKACGPISI